MEFPNGDLGALFLGCTRRLKSLVTIFLHNVGFF